MCGIAGVIYKDKKTHNVGESQREALSDYLLSDVQFPQHLYPYGSEERHRQG